MLPAEAVLRPDATAAAPADTPIKVLAPENVTCATAETLLAVAKTAILVAVAVAAPEPTPMATAEAE